MPSTSEDLHLDFETRSAVDLTKCGADVYSRHRSTEVMCAGYAVGDSEVLMWPGPMAASPIGLINRVRDGATVIAHNAAFELAIWNNVCVPKYGWSPLRAEQMQCTMAMAYAMALPGSLDNASAAVGMEQQKDMVGRRIMLQLSKPRDELPCPTCFGEGFDEWPASPALSCPPARTPCRTCHGEGKAYVWHDDPAKFERLLAYCRQDVEVERALHKRLMNLSDAERKVWVLDQKINQRGIRVDLKAVKAAIQIVELEQARLNKEMKKVTGGFVGLCTEVSALTRWLKHKGVEVESVAKQDVVELLERTDLPADCRAALRLRQEAAKTSTAKLTAMLKTAGPDHRIRGTLQYHAAGTGRWGGRLIQPQNFARGSLKPEEVEEVFEILKEVSNV